MEARAGQTKCRVDVSVGNQCKRSIEVFARELPDHAQPASGRSGIIGPDDQLIDKGRVVQCLGGTARNDISDTTGGIRLPQAFEQGSAQQDIADAAQVCEGKLKAFFCHGNSLDCDALYNNCVILSGPCSE